jgi:hypothetical protein
MRGATRTWILIVAVSLAPLMAAAEAEHAPEGELKLPLGEWERLRSEKDKFRADLDDARKEAAAEQERLQKQIDDLKAQADSQEAPSEIVVDTLHLSGSFRDRSLSVELSGKTSGRPHATKVLAADKALRLYHCEGNALLSRPGKAVEAGEDSGADPGTPAFDGFRLLAKGDTFRTRCRLGGVGSELLELNTTPAVLWIDSDVADGELLITDAADGGRTITLTRKSPTDGLQPVPVSAIGHYTITLEPDGPLFKYQIAVSNPNRTVAPLDLAVGANEQLQEVTAQGTHVFEGGLLKLSVPSGESTVTLSGTLSTNEFLPPLPSGASYVLLEANPLLRPTIEGKALRISPTQTGLTPKYRGAYAFLLYKGETLAWKTAKLEPLQSTSYSIPRVMHSFFIARDGLTLVESTYDVQNQGAPDLALTSTSTPLFASVGDEPITMARNADGALDMPLSEGAQSLSVQYRNQISPRFDIARGELSLPSVPGAATEARVDVRYSREWLPLYERFQSDQRYWTPSVDRVQWALLISALAWLVLRAIRLARWRALLLTAAIAPAAYASDMVAWIVVPVAAAALGSWVFLRMQRPALQRAILGGATALASILVSIGVRPSAVAQARRLDPTATPPPAAVPWAVNGFYVASRSPVSPSIEVCNGLDDDCDGSTEEMPGTSTKLTTALIPAPGSAPMYRPQSGAPLASTPNALSAGLYGGLPTRTVMPAGAIVTQWTAEMFETEHPRSVSVILVRRRLVRLLGTLLMLLPLSAFLLSRDRIRSGLRDLIHQVRFIGWPPPHPVG